VRPDTGTLGVHFGVYPILAKIGVYLRVSTRDQKHDAQRAEIGRWLVGHGYANQAVTWFEDTESGAKIDRPGFNALQAAIFAGRIRTVVIWKLDRVARSQREGINVLSDWCDKGVRVVSVTQQIDLAGTVGKLVAGVLFGIAEIELEHSKERQAAGIAEAKKRGVYRGRQVGTVKANPARARSLKAQGLTGAEIMAALGIRSRATLAKYLLSD